MSSKLELGREPKCPLGRGRKGPKRELNETSNLHLVS